MKQGDIIKIDGAFGFSFNPTLEVKEIKGGLVLLATYPPTPGGLLSHMNESWHGIDLIEKRLAPTN